MKSYSKRLWGILLLFLFIAACTSTTPTLPPTQVELPGPKASTSTVQENPTEYPAPALPSNPYPNPIAIPSEYPGPAALTTIVSPYPGPTSSTSDYSALFVFPTPDPALGKVHGTIYYKGKPVVYEMFFLADVVKSEKTGLEGATVMDRTTAPRAFSNENGLFTFVNVPPGRYGLILLVDVTTYLLLNPKNGEAILLTVEAGSDIDLGKLEYDELPLD